jgi:hypothetical protein
MHRTGRDYHTVCRIDLCDCRVQRTCGMRLLTHLVVIIFNHVHIFQFGTPSQPLFLVQSLKKFIAIKGLDFL